MFLPILRVHFKRKESASVSSNDAYAIFLCCFFFVILFIKAYVVGTHLNCINKSMQFWVPTTFAFKKYTGCNLKTIELLDCVLIGVCAVIRPNTVIFFSLCKMFEHVRRMAQGIKIKELDQREC